MKNNVCILIISMFLFACTSTQKTVAGGIMMGVGGITAGSAGYTLAASNDAGRSLRSAGVRSRDAFQDTNRLALSATVIGGTVFLLGSILLGVGINERSNEIKKRETPNRHCR